MSEDTGLSSDLQAMSKVDRALTGLDPEDTRRVLRWAVDKFGKGDKTLFSSLDEDDRAKGSRDDDAASNGAGSKAAGRTFGSISNLVEAVKPSTAAEHVLTGAYWFQMIKSAENVTAHQVNNELKNLGSSPSNITDVFTDLINRKPALVRQVAKSGTSRQARKKYRLTTEGIRSVESKIGG